ncbi:MAG: ribosome silencing factor [Pyrinomonadaceae bacterium]
MMNKKDSTTEMPRDDAERAETNAAATANIAELDEVMSLALHAASDKKAFNTVALDLRELASFTEYFLIASGTNVRQVQAISDEIEERLKKFGRRAQRIEGYRTAEWILLDYGDFIFHVFENKARHFYDLERLWRDAKCVSLPAEIANTESDDERTARRSL